METVLVPAMGDVAKRIHFPGVHVCPKRVFVLMRWSVWVSAAQDGERAGDKETFFCQVVQVVKSKEISTLPLPKLLQP